MRSRRRRHTLHRPTGQWRHDSEAVERSLIFRAAGRVYACDITAVREVMQLARVTPIPRAGAAVLGLMNLRGQVVTLVDAGVVLHGKQSRGPTMALLVDVGVRGVGLAVERVVDVRSLRSEEGYVQLDVRDLVSGVVSIEEES